MYHSRNCLIAYARFKSLSRLDTRAFELYSAAQMVVWSSGFYALAPFVNTSSYGRVDDYFSPVFGLMVLVPFALFHLIAILLNNSKVRRHCVMASLFWWSWLAFLMWQFPPNYSACLTFGLTALFCVWSYVAARLRDEVDSIKENKKCGV